MSDENGLFWIIVSYIALSCVVYSIGRQTGWQQGFEEGKKGGRVDGYCEGLEYAGKQLTRGKENGESGEKD